MFAFGLLAAEAHWLDRAIEALARLFPENTYFSFAFNIVALLALLLVSLSCGTVGSLVIGSRMAFFSDALAHCAFAGVSIGFLVFNGLVLGHRPASEFWEWVTPIMIGFGLLVSFGIASVRSRTGLASDTVIGVFFAGAIGLAAMLRKIIHNRQLFNMEDFLFGDPLLVSAEDLLWLTAMLLLTVGVMIGIYNSLLLTSFNSSLALSRRVRVQLARYLFIMLLAVIVNLSVRTVGVLLINALLIVPAATAVNLSRNMRQLFWLTIILCVGLSVAGALLSWELEVGYRLRLGTPGTIILLNVAAFTLSMYLGPWLRSRPRTAKAVQAS